MKIRLQTTVTFSYETDTEHYLQESPEGAAALAERAFNGSQMFGILTDIMSTADDLKIVVTPVG